MLKRKSSDHPYQDLASLEIFKTSKMISYKAATRLYNLSWIIVEFQMYISYYVREDIVLIKGNLVREIL